MSLRSSSSIPSHVVLDSPSALEQLVEEIKFQRSKEMRQSLRADQGGVLVQGTTYWTDLFVRHFLFRTDRNHDSDDLLFFVRKKHIRGITRYIPRYETSLEVFRKDSRKLPIGDPDIDWEETVYLNLLIHDFEYTLTMATCTRTSPKHLQILRRHSQKVWASPSRRRMDTKGDTEEVTYPNIFFMVDNFDEVFADIEVRDGEMVCVELMASDRDGSGVRGVTFLGSIRYEALKRVYDARASVTSKMAHRMTFGLFPGSRSQRMEFMRMKGPQGKGHAEMAIGKVIGSGVETPSSEPGFSFTDCVESEDEDEYPPFRQRRLSDPSSNLNTYIRPLRHRGSPFSSSSTGTGKSRSESEGLDAYANGLCEVEAGDPRDDVSPKSVQQFKVARDGTIVTFPPRLPSKSTELDDTAFNPLWTMRGAMQSFHFWKESRRLQSLPLNAYLTYITLPWYAIIRDVLDHREEPILTF